MSSEQTEARLEQAAQTASKLCAGLGERFFGQPALIEQLVAGLIADGHVLMEGTPGLGKTRLARSLAQLLELEFGRVQCTPDLMPGDITGGEVLDERDGRRSFRFVPGPVFCQVLLVDEINRATPRTQSALLEAMEERQISAGNTSHPLPEPFFLIATQNPIELEGTYPLPEAQLDRFLLKLEIGAPELAALEQILRLPTRRREPASERLLDAEGVRAMQEIAAELPLPAGLLERVAEIVRATHPSHESAPPAVVEQVQWGVSPRGGRDAIAVARGLALMRGRAHVAPQDLRETLYAALRHRLLLRYEARAAGVHPDAVLDELLQRYPIH